MPNLRILFLFSRMLDQMRKFCPAKISRHTVYATFIFIGLI